ncbi:hypothetical protein LUZ60_005861 [Juncus effusus]|nr:hypothetical protein LUZ60_005861 [Juncus effusus]
MDEDRGLAGLGSSIATIMFLWAVGRQYFPAHVESFLTQYISRLVGFFNPYVEITFPEFSDVSGDGSSCLARSHAYTAIHAYISAFCADHASRLRADAESCKTDRLTLVLEESDELAEDFGGATFWWSIHKSTSFFPVPQEHRYYRLSFHRRYRKVAYVAYLRHIIEEGERIQNMHRRSLRLYTNLSRSRQIHASWCHVAFSHPATFDSLAMDIVKKKEIINDLIAFSKGKEYYGKIGKPWKRGYFIYGPPGTGKTTMISAMANLLGYDVYDLDLSQIHDNSTLRKLLLEISNKSILVIEHLDHLQGLLCNDGKRKAREDREEEESEITFSGLLSYIDGLWSAQGEGVLLAVFTACHVDKIDPALIRKGRMDVHVKLGFCEFEGFRVLAKNYLGLDWHPKFELVKELLKVKEVTPADVAERIMMKNLEGVIDKEELVEGCIESLVEALKCAN